MVCFPGVGVGIGAFPPETPRNNRRLKACIIVGVAKELFQEGIGALNLLLERLLGVDLLAAATAAAVAAAAIAAVLGEEHLANAKA